MNEIMSEGEHKGWSEVEVEEDVKEGRFSQGL
jgi:hypothetical protein